MHAERNAPNNAYLELDAHPTSNDGTAFKDKIINKLIKLKDIIYKKIIVQEC